MKNEFKPKKGQTYWFVSYIYMYDKFVPDEGCWDGTQWEMGALQNKLIFPTFTECQSLCDKYNNAIRSVTK